MVRPELRRRRKQQKGELVKRTRRKDENVQKRYKGKNNEGDIMQKT
jgi:hypothetical protein